MYAFALLLICVGLVMLRRAYPGLFRGAARAGSSGVFSDDGAAAADNAGGTSSTPALRAVSATGEVTSIGAVPLWRVALVATITGALTGFFGVGGGFAIVPSLTLVLHLPIKRAATTAVMAMISSGGVSGQSANFPKRRFRGDWCVYCGLNAWGGSWGAADT